MTSQKRLSGAGTHPPQLSRSLRFGVPLPITEEELGENPAFSALLDDLHSRFFTNHSDQHDQGLRKPQRDEACQVHAALETEREHCLQNLFVYQELKDLLLDSEADKENGSFGNGGSEGISSSSLEVLKQALTTAEASLSLPIEPPYSSSSSQSASGVPCGKTVLGLTPSDVTSTCSLTQVQLQNLKMQVRPVLERRLMHRAEELSEFLASLVPHAVLDHPLDDTTEKSLFCQKLAMSARRVIADIEEEERRARLDELTQKGKLKGLLTTQEEVLRLSHELVSEHYLKHGVQSQQCLLEWDELRLETLIAKMDALRARVTARSYTPDTLQALGSIHEMLLKDEKEITDQVADAHRRLKEYECVTPEFEDLVSEYKELMRKTDTTMWNLRQLHQDAC